MTPKQKRILKRKSLAVQNRILTEMLCIERDKREQEYAKYQEEINNPWRRLQWVMSAYLSTLGKV